MNLLPYPRSVQLDRGTFKVAPQAALHLPAGLPRETVMLPLAGLLGDAAAEAGIELELITGPQAHPNLAIAASESSKAPAKPEGYSLVINAQGVRLLYHDVPGLRAGCATLCQLLREHGKGLPCLRIEDYPDFPRRGIMLDVSRGRVPSLATLLDLVEHLARFKINEFQLYTEHTFAYRNYRPVWERWGALTGEEILQLDARCRELGIDLVPNQNSFGHLRYWLEHPPLKKLAEVSEPYEGTGGTFLRYPTTLAPTHPETLPFLQGLFDELLPHFTSSRFNVGCDETWDLGRGQSKEACEKLGKGRVYVDFLKSIHREASARGKQMMFWGDIILHNPELIKDLPEDMIALNWGYETNHPFEKETATFAESGRPFYVCPGTSTWMSLIGRHENGFENLRLAAASGLKNGAQGFLNTDWGDGGHPQPLAVSWPLYLAGAALSWCGASYDSKRLVPVLSREVYYDRTERIAKAALALGVAHLKFNYLSPNVTPYGGVIAAPVPKTRELFCRDGLKYYARISEKNILAALAEVRKQRDVLYRSETFRPEGELLAAELDMASRMAEESCHIMLWQQKLAAGKQAQARTLARAGIKRLQELDQDFNMYWPLRNKGTTATSTPFLRWRQDDYRKGILHFPPEAARPVVPKTYAAE